MKTDDLNRELQRLREASERVSNNLVELEYGTKAWWTTELYLHGQTTAHQSTVFTGFRFENRFRRVHPLRRCRNWSTETARITRMPVTRYW